MNYIELHIGDYYTDTMGLTLLEHGVYFRLLNAYYKTERPLPSDYKSLYELCGGRLMGAERQAVNKIADRYFPIGEDGLRHNNRADEEIESYRHRVDSARENGRRGGVATAKAKAKRNDSENEATAANPVDRNHSSPDTIPHTPDSSHHTPSKLPNGSLQIPEALLAISGFAEQWGKWEQHRKEIKKRLTDSMREEQWSFLALQPDPIAVIKESIRGGWQGLFEIKSNGRKPVQVTSQAKHDQGF